MSAITHRIKGCGRKAVEGSMSGVLKAGGQKTIRHVRRISILNVAALTAAGNGKVVRKTMSSLGTAAAAGKQPADPGPARYRAPDPGTAPGLLPRHSPARNDDNRHWEAGGPGSRPGDNGRPNDNRWPGRPDGHGNGWGPGPQHRPGYIIDRFPDRNYRVPYRGQDYFSPAATGIAHRGRATS